MVQVPEEGPRHFGSAQIAKVTSAAKKPGILRHPRAIATAAAHSRPICVRATASKCLAFVRFPLSLAEKFLRDQR